MEAEPEVGQVTLAEQKEKDVIDNRVVYVAIDDNFDPDHAIAALAGAKFSGVSVTNS